MVVFHHYDYHIYLVEELVKIMVDSDMAKVAAEGAAAKVRTNLAEYLEKGIVK